MALKLSARRLIAENMVCFCKEIKCALFHNRVRKSHSMLYMPQCFFIIDVRKAKTSDQNMSNQSVSFIAAFVSPSYQLFKFHINLRIAGGE
uniref:Uncharacterized protein n=1 Tax=Arundo donax TaxID=35708 RepID=A0A0A8YYH8_ARUDO